MPGRATAGDQVNPVSKCQDVRLPTVVVDGQSRQYRIAHEVGEGHVALEQDPQAMGRRLGHRKGGPNGLARLNHACTATHLRPRKYRNACQRFVAKQQCGGCLCGVGARRNLCDRRAVSLVVGRPVQLLNQELLRKRE